VEWKCFAKIRKFEGTIKVLEKRQAMKRKSLFTTEEKGHWKVSSSAGGMTLSKEETGRARGKEAKNKKGRSEKRMRKRRLTTH